MVGIYKITNPENKIYIGYSTFLEKRQINYKNKTVKTQNLIKNSIEKYGWENHKFEIIEECIKEELKEREIFWIKYYNSNNIGLNQNKGGGGPTNHTEYSKQLISKKGKLNKGKRENSHWKGKNLSDKHILNNKLNKGKRENSHWKGKKRGEDFSNKISLAKKNKPLIKNCKPILQYDLQDNFIREWQSISEANISLGKNKNNSDIGGCCKGRKKTTFKFKWKYK